MTYTPESKNQLLDVEGAVVNWPQTSPQEDGGDGTRTPILLPNIIPPGYLAYITGAFDNISTDTRGEGDQMVVTRTDVGQQTKEGRFLEHFYVLNGSYRAADPALITDWVSMHLYGGASTSPTNTPGTGNADKVTYGGGNLFKPNSAGTGDWTVDGTTLEAGEINQGLVPIPAYSGGVAVGYWNWDPEVSPSITPVTDPDNPDGGYHLFDFAVGVMARQANRLPLKGGCENCVPEPVKGKKILPHWTIVFTVNRSEEICGCSHLRTDHPSDGACDYPACQCGGYVAAKVGAAFEMKVARKTTV